MVNWQEHIYSDEKVLAGKPVIKNTRISIELILELLSNDWTQEMILESYPNLESEDIKAVFAYQKD